MEKMLTDCSSLHNNLPIVSLSSDDFAEIIDVWESSVRATHHFLSEQEIAFYKPLVPKYALPSMKVFGMRLQNKLTGYMAVSDYKVEMLFIAPEFIGKGLGKQLLSFALNKLHIYLIDVNEENPKLKQWLDERDNKKECLNKQLTMDEQFEENNQYFSNMFALNKYKFDPYTLEYFNKYISIVRKKILILLDIIEKIGNKNTSSIKDIILDLDIELDAKGNILKEDIDRLIKPTVVNIHILQEKFLLNA